jgi:predicted anti-sigma-YlaC factor YlaD
MRIVRANCDRARRWASLRLDAELSELESRLLDAHLERCAECREYEFTVASLTHELRAAALVQLDLPITLPRRGRISHRGLRSAAAAAASVAAVTLAAIFALTGTTGPSARIPASFPALRDSEARDVRELRRAEMKPLPVKPVATHVQNVRST